MGPPQDVVMGPPPVPAQGAPPQAAQKPPKDADVTAKYSRLKRKYFELEEVSDRTHTRAILRDSTLLINPAMLPTRAIARVPPCDDLVFSRNTKRQRCSSGAPASVMSSGGQSDSTFHRLSTLSCITKFALSRLLLDRITELECNPATNGGAILPAPPFTAFPRSLLVDKNQKLFVTNLRQAIDEIEREDPDIDPHLLSRHISPAARRRIEADIRERQEEEAREAIKRTGGRKPRGGGPAKGKDVGAPLTYAPTPFPHSHPPPPAGGTPSSPVLVSSDGARLRIKPPAPPGMEGVPGTIPPPPAAQFAGPPPGHGRRHSESLSPDLSPQDEYVANQVEGMSPPYQHGAPPSQSQMQMTIRTSSAGSLPSDLQRHTKPKRLKAHTVMSKTAHIPTIPRDKNKNPVLPLNVGIMTVLNLGEVCMREHFHTERYIFPVGYEVTRCARSHALLPFH